MNASIVRFHFHENNGLISQLIQWKTGSAYSHVSVEVGGQYYQSYIDNEFYRTPERPGDIKETIEVLVDQEYVDKIEVLLEAELGNHYDYRSVFGFIFNTDKHNRRAWYCSEMAIEALTIITGNRMDFKKMISPEAVRIAVQYFVYGVSK